MTSRHGGVFLFAAGVVAGAVILVGDLLSRSFTPPGADPGHMLAQSLSLGTIGPEGPSTYAPALPFIGLLLRRWFADSVPGLMTALKVLGVLLLTVEALGLALLGWRRGSGATAAWTLALAVTNPNSWNQLMWGGYAQFLGVGLGACGLALLPDALDARAPSNRPRLLLAGLLFGAVVLAHGYGALFFAVAASASVVLASMRARSFEPVRRGAAVLVIATVAAAPSLAAHLRLVRASETTAAPLLWRVEGYLVALADVAQGVHFHRPVNGAMAALLVLAVVLRRDRVPCQRFRDLWLSWLAGCTALLAVTPPMLLARVGLFGWHGVVLYQGAVLGAGSRRSQRAQLFSSAVMMATVTAAALLTWRDLAQPYPQFGALDGPTVAMMQDLGTRATGRVAVLSPSPEADGWWLEALTGRTALIGGHLKWHLRVDERARCVAAKRLGFSRRMLAGGSLDVLDEARPAEGCLLSLWANDGLEYFPLLKLRPRFLEGRSTEESNAGRLLERDSNAASLSESRSGACGVLHQDVRGNDGGALFSWRLEPRGGAACGLEVQIGSPEGSRVRAWHAFASAYRADTEFLYEPFRWRGLRRAAEVRVASAGPWRADVHGGVLRLTAAASDRPRDLLLELRVPGLTPAGWRTLRDDELLAQWGVSHLWVRGSNADLRFAADSRFERVSGAGDVVVYRLSPR